MRQTAVIEDWLPEQLANGPHGHWTERRKKLLYAGMRSWAAATRAEWKPVTSKAKLTIVLVFPNRRRRDTDNLYSRCKGVCDGLKRWLIDDDIDHLELVVRAEVRPNVRQVELTLETL